MRRQTLLTSDRGREDLARGPGTHGKRVQGMRDTHRLVSERERVAALSAAAQASLHMKCIRISTLRCCGAFATSSGPQMLIRLPHWEIS